MNRKRKTTVKRAPLARSLTRIDGCKFSPAASSSLISGNLFIDHLDGSTEQIRMAREEQAQRIIDRFWGLDKDRADRCAEINAMKIEEGLSTMHEHLIRVLKLHGRWEEEHQQHLTLLEFNQRECQKRQRQDHLRLINSPMPVEDLLHCIWNLDDKEPMPLMPNIASLYHQSNHGSTSLTKAGEGSQTSGAVDLNQSLDSVKMSVHLEGLQRSREIVDQAKGLFKHALKEIYNRVQPSLNETSPKKRLIPRQVAQTMSDSRLSSRRQTKAPAKTPETKKNVSNNKPLAPSTPDLLVATVESRNQLIDGHPHYKWDQTSMLRSAFQLLDQGGKGYLLLQDLALLSYDPKVHELLRFTVYWTVIKKKQWDFFHQLLDSVPNQTVSTAQQPQQPSGRSGMLAPLPAELSRTQFMRSEKSRATSQSQQSTVPPRDSLQLHDWLEGARQLSRQLNVSIRSVRDQREHETICRRTSFVHEHWNEENRGIIRHFALARSLQVGDCVWALHHNGVLWLPAVIENIHPVYGDLPAWDMPHETSVALLRDPFSWISSDSVLHPQDRTSPSLAAPPSNHPLHRVPYIYDLHFPLNEEELLAARMACTSRQLLTLPSEKNQLVASARGSRFAVKPLKSELQVCSYAYDLIDVEGRGIMELTHFIDKMQSESMFDVMITSIILSSIFDQRTSSNLIEEQGANMQEQLVESLIQSSSLSVIRKMKNKSKYEINFVHRAMPLLLPVLIDTFTPMPPTLPSSTKLHTIPDHSNNHEDRQDNNRTEGEEEVKQQDAPFDGTSLEDNSFAGQPLPSQSTADKNLPQVIITSNTSLGSSNYEEDDWSAMYSNNEELPAQEDPKPILPSGPEDGHGANPFHQTEKTDQTSEQDDAMAWGTGQHGSDEVPTAEKVWLSKIDFMEFCKAVHFVILYDIHQLRSVPK